MGSAAQPEAAGNMLGLGIDSFSNRFVPPGEAHPSAIAARSRLLAMPRLLSTLGTFCLPAFILAGAALLSLSPAGASPPAVFRDGWAFFPERNFQPLPGRAVGILAGDSQSALQAENRNGPADALYFSADGTSYR